MVRIYCNELFSEYVKKIRRKEPYLESVSRCFQHFIYQSSQSLNLKLFTTWPRFALASFKIRTGDSQFFVEITHP